MRFDDSVRIRYPSQVTPMFPLRLRPGGLVLNVVTAGAMILLSVGAASAQSVTRNPDGTVSVTASALPLGDVLRAVGKVSPFDKLVLQPAVEAVPVTLSVANVSVEEALTLILRNAGVNYVMAGHARLAVGDPAMLASMQRNENPEAVQPPAKPTREDPDVTEQTPRSEADPRDRADQSERAADLERVLVPPPGAPAYQPGYAVLPGENGGTTMVPLPLGGTRPAGPSLPGLGSDPASKPGASLPSWVPVPAALQPLVAVPVRKTSEPKK